MLYKLEVENFFSIRDRQVLDLTVAPNVPDPDNRYATIFPGSPNRAPKVIAIYGANASGKSSLIRALEFVVTFIRDSAARPSGFPCERFNDDASKSRPIFLAIEFGGVMNWTPEVEQRRGQGLEVEWGTYRYELIIGVRDGNPFRVESETLRQRPKAVGKWQRVFERNSEGRLKDSRSFSLSGFQHLLNTLLPHASVLASFAMFRHPTAQLFVDTARELLFQTAPHANIIDQGIVDYLVSQPDVVVELNRELSRIDVGVEQMHLVETPTGPQPFFKHSGLEFEMPWILESQGTRTFIKMFPALSRTLATGSVVAIDELDSSIHPLVLPEILRWFYSAERNPHDGQLWFSCHAVSLMEELNKEEMVICEKDRLGRTSFFSLMDVQSQRRDNFYKKYLSGVYGGVPRIG